MDNYLKHIKNLNKYITLENTKDILKTCLNIDKNTDDIDKINKHYDNNNIAYFLNDRIRQYLSVDININFEHKYEELRSYSNKNENKIVYDDMFFQLIMDFYLMIFDWVYHDNDIDQEIYFNKLFYILI